MVLFDRRSIIGLVLVFWVSSLWSVFIFQKKLVTPVQTQLSGRMAEDLTTAPKIRKANFIAFIRIRKTGSTTLVEFLKDFSGMENLFNTLPNETRLAFDPKPHKLPCIYGPSQAVHGTNGTMPARLKNGCGHYEYPRIHKVALLGVDHWANQTLASDLSIQAVHTRLDMLTIVRDPFDRLRSLFYHVRKDIERQGSTDWRYLFTRAQNEKVLSGDFVGFIQLVHKENLVPMNRQYGFIDAEVDMAISLIQGKSPNVTVLVNECLEASLRLMEEKHTLRPGAADDFFSQPRRRSRANQGKYETNVENDTILEELREKSKIYLMDEYRFYNAAVEQFKRQLASSTVDHPCDL